MSTEKQIRQLPTTEEAKRLAGQGPGIEGLSGTVLLDRYRLIELIGAGGASVVYRGEHILMRKDVAVKILRPEQASRKDYIERFLNEARAVARLRHEHIVDTVDIGRTETGLVFCVMEYLHGEELGDALDREGPMPWPRVKEIARQVCEALSAAHAAGIVHRDVKPQNCFLVRRKDGRDFVKLLDFGISKQLDQGQGLTATGVIMGTAEYMSPEQARGQPVDARADIYSVGAMLFEMLTGRPPFEGQSFLDVLLKQVSERPPRLGSLVPGIPTGVDALVARALAKKPDDRFQSLDDLVAALAVAGEQTVLAAIPEPIAVDHSAPATVTQPSPQVSPREPGHPVAARLPTTSAQLIVGSRTIDGGSLLAITLAVILVPLAIWGAVSVVSGEDSPTDEGSIENVPPLPPTSESPGGSPETLPAELPNTEPLPETSRAPSETPTREEPAEPEVLEVELTEQPPASSDADGSPPISNATRRQKKVDRPKEKRSGTVSPFPPEDPILRKARQTVSAAIQRSCEEFVFQEYRVTIHIKGGSRRVTTDPAAPPMLQTCLAEKVRKLPQDLPNSDYHETLRPKRKK